MQEHSEKLQNLVNDALDKGAEIVGRGSVGNIGEGAVEQYFPPTVIVNVNHTMKLMQDEVLVISHTSYCSEWNLLMHFITVETHAGFWTNYADYEI